VIYWQAIITHARLLMRWAKQLLTTLRRGGIEGEWPPAAESLEAEQGRDH
jgi:hypothetical protein